MTHKFSIVSCSDDDFVCASQSEPGGTPPNEQNIEPVLTADELREENHRLRTQLAGRVLRDIVGQSSAIAQLRERIARIDNEHPVLILGEPGSGVETTAQAIHACSRRAHRPLVKIDCLLLTADRLEQELTPIEVSGGVSMCSSEAAKPNRLHLSMGGTLLLKNIDAVPLPLQRKLALLLRDQRIDAMRSGRPHTQDVRFLASSSEDLERLVAEQKFREDLLVELTVRRITVPALRDRIHDVGLLTEHFLSQAAVAEGKPPKRLTVEALKVLQGYDWPGNVAELRNVVERACVLDTGELLTVDLVRSWIAGQHHASGGVNPGMSLREMERKLIETTFARCEGNRERTAQALQIGLRTLSGKLREYGYPPRGGPLSKWKASQLKAA